jgi:DNA ligase (NAD+)
MSTVDNVNAQLEAARKAYYAGSPIMSDAEYDTLEQQIAGLSKQQPGSVPSVLTTVGTDQGGRIPHKFPMRSIANTYTEDELLAFYREQAGPYTLSSKWDGVSCSLTYDDGSLIQALTRGDGDAGEDILPQILAVASIPHSIPHMGLLNVRGELVIAQSTLDKLNIALSAKGLKPYMSTRNLVAGTMKLKDLSEIPNRNVQFMPWEVLGDNLPDSAMVGLLDLEKYGFRKPDDEIILTEEELLTRLRRRVFDLTHDKQEIGRDGFVLKVDRTIQRRELGLGSKFANFQVCFKPQNAKAESILREVRWQVGRQGRLTPVGVIDPVVLAGATITNVTLNNQSWIDDMGLKIGSRVMVVRSGDVIPQITEVLDA